MTFLLWALGGAAGSKLANGDPLIGAALGAIAYLCSPRCECSGDALDENAFDESHLEVNVPRTAPECRTGCNVYYPGMEQ